MKPMKQATLKHRLILCLLLIAILWIFLIVRIFTDALNFAFNLAALIFLSACDAAITVYLVKDSGKYRKLNELLERDCNPEAFVAEIRAAMDREAERKRPGDRQKLSIYLAGGLYAWGRFQEALDALITAEPSTRGAYGKADTVRWHHYLLLVCLKLGKPDTAAKAAADLKQALGSMGNGSKARLLRRKYDEDLCLLEMAEGNFEGAEDVFREAFLRAQSNYERVSAAYNRASVYEHLGRDAQAREFYAFVAKNGNGLFITKKAAERLGL